MPEDKMWKRVLDPAHKIIAGLAGLVCLLSYFGITPNSVGGSTPTPMAAPAPSAWWLVFAVALFVYTVGSTIHSSVHLKKTIRSLERQNEDLQATADRPLRIIYAHWGPSDTVYEDRTQQIQKVARSDSLDCPVSISVLGDPYVGVVKELTVAYSYTGTVRVREKPIAQHLVLPEHREVGPLRERVQQLERNLALVQGHKRQQAAAAPHGESSANHRPKLTYVMCESGGARAFQVPLNKCDLQVARMRNTQVAVKNTASNVRARIRYSHDDGVHAITADGRWLPSLSARMDLAGEEEQGLIITMQQQSTELVFTVPDTEGAFSAILPGGHWHLKVEITSDNSDDLVLEGGFTLGQDGRKLRFDTPALAVTLPLSVRELPTR